MEAFLLPTLINDQQVYGAVLDQAVATGYVASDFNLDASVTASDFNLWLVNTKLVPAPSITNCRAEAPLATRTAAQFRWCPE